MFYRLNNWLTDKADESMARKQRDNDMATIRKQNRLERQRLEVFGDKHEGEIKARFGVNKARGMHFGEYCLAFLAGIGAGAITYPLLDVLVFVSFVIGFTTMLFVFDGRCQRNRKAWDYAVRQIQKEQAVGKD